MKNSLLITLALISFSGCTNIKTADDGSIASIVDMRLQKDVHWNRSTCNCQILETVEQLLQEDLTVDSAVQIALLNNPIVQRSFEEIGIAYGDLLEAGLLQNPIFEAFFRYPNKRSFCLNTEFAVTQSIVDVFLLPLRKRIAGAAFAQAELKTANSILNLAFEVEEIYYKLAAETKNNQLLNELVDLAEASCQLSEAQYQAGSINILALQSEKNEFLVHKIALAQSHAEIIKLTEQMNVLLGLDSSVNCWVICGKLPKMPDAEVSESCLESIALSRRLDLEAARWEVEKIIRTGATMQWWAYTNFAAGFAGEKDPGGLWTQGPAIAGSIPIFNHGQADRERLYAKYKWSIHQLEVLQIAVLAELHSAKERLLVQREIASRYENELLPLQKQIVATSQEYYHAMALSVYRLLDSKKQEIRMDINFTNALKNYWLTRVDLNRSLGGYIWRAEDESR